MAAPAQARAPSNADAAFEEFVLTRSVHLFRLALLLTGWNTAVAEDLTQTVLERAYGRRRSLFGADRAAEPYVRRMLVNASIDWRRGMRRRAELPLDAAARLEASDRSDAVADRDLLIRALAAVPPRQRAVLVLRYWEDLPDAEIGATLNCGVATVRSQASRGLERLRKVIDLRPGTAAELSDIGERDERS